MRITVQAPDIDRAMKDVDKQIQGFVTRAMRAATEEMKAEGRDQVRRAGMSQRLANTWRAVTFPDSTDSLNPAGYMWSNAPAIIDSFSSGNVIRTRNGSRYLAIPTPAVPPRARREARRRKGSLALEVETLFNQDLIFIKDSKGGLGAYISATLSRNGRSFVRPSAGRARQGRRGQLVKMFTLVRQVTPRKRFDLTVIAATGQLRFAQRLQQEWR